MDCGGPWKFHLSKKSQAMTDLAALCAKAMDEQNQELAAVTFESGASILVGSSDRKREDMREIMRKKREAAVAAGSAKKKRVVTVTIGAVSPIEDGPNSVQDNTTVVPIAPEPSD